MGEKPNVFLFLNPVQVYPADLIGTLLPQNGEVVTVYGLDLEMIPQSLGLSAWVAQRDQRIYLLFF